MVARLEQHRSPATAPTLDGDTGRRRRRGRHHGGRLRAAQDERRLRGGPDDGQPAGLGTKALDVEEG